MRHQKNKITLDRKSAGRKALLRGLAESLILFEKITTTKAKGRATRSFVERLITKAKQNTLAARRLTLAKIPAKNVVKKLFEVLGPRYAERKGGYTRVTLLNHRIGDGAEEVLVELI
ncbi:MAG: 50S ribosomal protein L17 [Candidatus Magasanikbacteria bacterium]|nr:50S ribosomal protein L17 [Candidatus Magasanikbacteria bacterium]